jgi:hypothetical protein
LMNVWFWGRGVCSIWGNADEGVLSALMETVGVGVFGGIWMGWTIEWRYGELGCSCVVIMLYCVSFAI